MYNSLTKYSLNILYFFRIPKEVWTKVTEEIGELFPTEPTDIYYEPYYKNSSGETVKARGNLYTHYIYVRGQLREADLLKVNDTEEEIQSPQGMYTRFSLKFMFFFSFFFILLLFIIFQSQKSLNVHV